MRWLGLVAGIGVGLACLGARAQGVVARPGVIAGNVYTAEGDALERAQVEALRAEPGGEGAAVTRVGVTDDRGAYRLFGLTPGRYFLRVRPEAGDDGERGESFLFPGTVNADEAAVIEVKPGAEVRQDVVAPEEMPAVGKAAPGNGSVHGVVVEPGGGRPVARALVELGVEGKDGRRQPLKRTRTDNDGRFRIDGLAGGRYVMRVSHAGYLAGSARREVEVHDAEETKALRFLMMPEGVIAGRIVADGEPVTNASVTANGVGMQNGEPALVTAERAYSNDRGEYRIFGLRPGTYYVSATSGGATGVAKEGFQPTFFPDTGSFSEALPVQLAQGTRLESVDLRMERAHRWTVTGRVMAAPGHAGFAGAGVVLGARDGLLASKVGEKTATVASDGSFVVEGVWPGTYLAVATLRAAGETFSGVRTVEVRHADVHDVAVGLRPALKVEGRAVVEDEAPCALGQKRVVLRGKGTQGASQTVNAAVEDDGSFTAEGVRPDVYSVELEGDGKDCFLDRVEVGGQAVSAEAVPLLEAPVEMGLELSTAVGSVTGDVVDENGAPANGAEVVVMSQGGVVGVRELRRKEVADAEGKFSVGGLPPGGYRVVALAAGMDAGQEDAGAGERVDVEKGTASQVRISLGR